MVYGFVRQSNGHIRIDSAIGQGTSVKLYLPRTLDPVAESAKDVRRIRPPAASASWWSRTTRKSAAPWSTC